MLALGGAAQTFFHVGVVVPDLEAAMAELGPAIGADWSGPLEREVGEWVVRATFAQTAPPYVELIEAVPGSVWEATPGAPIHHMSYWSDDLDADGVRLEAAGMALELDLQFIRYHRGKTSATRIELLDSGVHAAFFERWDLPQQS